MRELVRLPFFFLYRILMPAGEFEMSGLERGHSDLTTSDSFLFERKERDRVTIYANTWLPVIVKHRIRKTGSRTLLLFSLLANLLRFIFA